MQKIEISKNLIFAWSFLVIGTIYTVTAIGLTGSLFGRVVSNYSLFAWGITFLNGFNVIQMAVSSGIPAIDSGTFEYSMSEPESLIDVDNLFQDKDSSQIIIDIFSTHTLDSYLKLYLKTRDATRRWTTIEEFPLIFASFLAIIEGAFAIALIYTGDYVDQTFGYGSAHLLVLYSIIVVLYSLFTHFYFAAKFNGMPAKLIGNLENLKRIYTKLKLAKSVQGEDEVTLDARHKFLLKILEHRGLNVNFDLLNEKADNLILDVKRDQLKKPFKILGLVQASTGIIATLIAGLAGIGSTCIASMANTTISLLSRPIIP